MNYSEQYREHIECSFNGFYKTVLYYEAVNAYREISRKREREVSLDYLYEMGCEPSAAEQYLTTFNIRGEAITIENEQLAAAPFELDTTAAGNIVFVFLFRVQGRGSRQAVRLLQNYSKLQEKYRTAATTKRNGGVKNWGRGNIHYYLLK